jgi:hypothetical protein
MSYYSDSQLEALLDDHETDQAERKESWAGDARPKGRIDDQLLLTLSDIKTDG